MSTKKPTSLATFAAWSLPVALGAVSLTIERLTRSDSEGWLWYLAARGVFLNFLAPICLAVLARMWWASPPIDPAQRLTVAVMAAPTVVVTLGVVALLLQTFVGFPLE